MLKELVTASYLLHISTNMKLSLRRKRWPDAEIKPRPSANLVTYCQKIKFLLIVKKLSN